MWDRNSGGRNDSGMVQVVYTQAIEEMRSRRSVEWQTFAMVNIIYGVALKVLWSYEGTISPSSASIITGFLMLFTWVWFIRIYGNGRRYGYLTTMRRKIQDDLGYPDMRCVKDGGWRCWKKGWPLWSYGGICFVIIMYFAVLMALLWFGAFTKTDPQKTFGQLAWDKLDKFSSSLCGITVLLSVVVIGVVSFLVFVDWRIAEYRYESTHSTQKTRG